MKIESKQAGFQHLTITIETLQEAAQLAAIVGRQSEYSAVSTGNAAYPKTLDGSIDAPWLNPLFHELDTAVRQYGKED